MKKLLAFLAFVLLASAALAQDTIPNHSIPIGRGPGVVGWGVLGPCSMGQVPTFQGPGNDPICGTGGGGGGTGSLGWVVVTSSPFNATGDGTTDDTAALQAAIDFAYANGIQTIYMPKPANCYKTTNSLYLDAPGNLRSNFASPPLAAFSLALQGEPGTGNHEDHFGSRICPAFVGSPYLIVGTGQGMKVSNISLVGQGGLQAQAYRCGRLATGGPGPASVAEAGIYIAGGGGGSTRALIQEVMVENAYYGIAVGLNNGNLGDSNSFRKIFLVNNCAGIVWGSSQNFINDCIACNMASYGTAFAIKQGTELTVIGGDVSSINAKSVGVTSLTAVAAITATPSPNLVDYTFNATLTAPAYNGGTTYGYGDVVSSGGQVWWCLGFGPPCTANTPSLSTPASWEVFANYMPILNAAAIVTPHYGVIPVEVTSYTQATGAITLHILRNWSYYYFGTFNAVTNGDLQNEIGTAPTIYFAEMATVMEGSNINVTGMHIENPGMPTRLFHTLSSLAGSAASAMNNVRLNFNPVDIGGHPGVGTPAAQALYYIAQSWPTIQVENTPLAIRGSSFDVNTSTPWIIDINLNNPISTPGGIAFKMDNQNFQYSPMVVRPYGGGNALTSSWSGPGTGPALGQGTEFEVTPFVPQNIGNPGNGVDGSRMRVNWGQGPSWGVRPAAWTQPCIRPADFTTLSGALPAWTGTAPNNVFGYPFIYGGQVYSLCEWYVGTQTHYVFESTHHFYSMGQNLTTTNVPGLSWSYKGQGVWVYADATTLGLLWPGVQVILNDGASDILYVVTGVYPPLGYFTVARGDNANGGVLSGGKTSIITGTLIKQEPYSLVFP